MSYAPLIAPATSPAIKAFRVLAALFGVLLAVQFAWLISAESIRPENIHLPTNPLVAAALISQRGAAARSAEIGAIRGRLWAEVAYTYGTLMWDDTDTSGYPDTVYAALDHALSDAPHQFAAWLLLSKLGRGHQLDKVSVLDALKMSYFTGPSESELIPLRFQIAIAADAFDDAELQESVKRDIRILLNEKNTSGIAVVFNSATTPGKQFIERTIANVDPSALNALKAITQSQSPRN